MALAEIIDVAPSAISMLTCPFLLQVVNAESFITDQVPVQRDVGLDAVDHDFVHGVLNERTPCPSLMSQAAALLARQPNLTQHRVRLSL